MVVCTYFQQGRCKYGDRCRFEHPSQSALGSGNRFGVLSGGGFGGSQQQQPLNYGVNANDIKTDLTAGKGRPEWIFSSYGPGKNAPRQLFGGPQREQSFEEMRLRHYEAAAGGNMNQAVQEAQALYADSIRQMEVALSDLDGAVKYVIEGANEHPNRLDIVEGKKGAGFDQGLSGQPAQGAAFSQPSALAGNQPSFGQPASFGQPSASGPPSGFGQPSNLGQGSTFGKPSGLGGQPAFAQPSFGQSGFAKPSIAQPSFGQPAFGKPSAPGPSTFGQPSTVSPFSQISNQNNQPSGFGQPSGQQGISPFPQPSGQQPAPTGFGQPSQPTPGPFEKQGQPQPFGLPSTGQGPFGAPQPAQPQPVAQQPAPAGFGQPAAQPSPADNRKRAFIKVDDPNELNPLPYMTGQTVRDPMSNKLSLWKGQPVKYINDYPCYLHPQDRSTFVRILFPNGPPDPASLRDAQAKPEEYTPEVNEQYDFFFSNGYFKDGVIPPIPPKSEWLSFDF